MATDLILKFQFQCRDAGNGAFDRLAVNAFSLPFVWVIQCAWSMRLANRWTRSIISLHKHDKSCFVLCMMYERTK